jgi:hypothetical protein
VCIANKSDLANERVLDANKSREFCMHDLGAIGYFEASAKTGENVERAFITAATHVLNRAAQAQRRYGCPPIVAFLQRLINLLSITATVKLLKFPSK